MLVDGRHGDDGRGRLLATAFDMLTDPGRPEVGDDRQAPKERTMFDSRTACDFAEAAGMVVVDPDGFRLGEVEGVVTGRRGTHLAVVSGGILGLARSRVFIPIGSVTKMADRLHVDRTYADVHRRPARDACG